MLRGTRVLVGDEAAAFVAAADTLRRDLVSRGYGEVILPALWERRTFEGKAGPELLSQMWQFKDRGDRDVCLIPEATAVIQELYRDGWAKSRPKPLRLFYITRCYRYDRPQRGRYREFTQVGVEHLGGTAPADRDEVIDVLRGCLDQFAVAYRFVDAVKRGLSYYVEDGFEVECDAIGSQKQLAGGGRYAEGVGWAIGLDRLLLAGAESGLTPHPC